MSNDSTVKNTLPMAALIGHRGLPIQAPENTEASLRIAAEHGIKWVEIDVTMAGDGTLVVMHDTNLKLFGLPNIELKDIDKAFLETIDAGRWFGKKFEGEKLLFLPDLLRITEELELSLNLEIKINPSLDCKTQVVAVFNALVQNNRINSQLVVSSFNHEALTHLRSLSPEIQIGVLFDMLPDDTVGYVAPIKPVSIHCEQSKITEALVASVKKTYPIYCYTVNSTDDYKKLLAWGVSGVFCDRAHSEDMREIAQAFGPIENEQPSYN